MAADMNKMTKFFHSLFRETDDPGLLTNRIMRQKYLDHAGLDKLSDAQEAAFKGATIDAFQIFEKEKEDADDSEDFKNKPETNKKRKQSKSSKSDSKKPPAKRSKKKDSSSDEDDFKPSKGRNNSSKSGGKKAAAVKSTSKKKTSVVKAAESSSEDEVLVKKQPEKKCVPIKSAKAQSEEDTSEDEVLVKGKGDVKKDDKPAEKESDQDESQSSDEEADKNEVKKETPPSKEKKSDSDSEEELKSAGDTNGKHIPHKAEKKPTKKKPKTKKTESSEEKEDSDIEKMKSYVRAAGIRIQKYSKLFEDCPDKTSKLNKLKSVLEEAGLKGRPSIKACQKIKKIRETAKEVAELDMENILEESSGRTRRNTPKAKTAKKEEQKSIVPDENGKNVFARLQDIVDSE